MKHGNQEITGDWDTVKDQTKNHTGGTEDQPGYVL